ncbi:hypothetical protein G3I62_27280 [Streptomyces sp. SID14446]|uniref:hypothetical protein n=1 Tax=Streptomyces sp. SID14446 TaxID=2706072 RepID=UPI0013BC3F17|nr:hypothetical protein [Streptomyces sp. SID14446]NEB32752.1 hypothetical protein [Streptomyces sp. SID14446]
MHETDFGAPTRRRTRYADDVEELRYLGLELAEDGAYVSPGRAPWRGLSGHDPYDDLTDDEFAERAREDWDDALYDEDDPERPQRRRPSGRGYDIEPPIVHDVEVRVDPAVAAEFAARQAEADTGSSWAVDGGRVTISGSVKTWRGACAQCAAEFEQRRPVSQRRRWKSLCSEVCAAGWERDRARERKRRQRDDAA